LGEIFLNGKYDLYFTPKWSTVNVRPTYGL